MATLTSKRATLEMNKDICTHSLDSEETPKNSTEMWPTARRNDFDLCKPRLSKSKLLTWLMPTSLFGAVVTKPSSFLFMIWETPNKTKKLVCR